MNATDIHSNILRPQPRRPGTFNLTPLYSPSADTSTEHSPVTSPTGEQSEQDAPPLVSRSSTSRSTATLSALRPMERTRSILNLTSSTLFGIYDSAADLPLATPTPYGTGSLTPARTSSAVDLVSAGLGDGTLRANYTFSAVQERPSQRVAFPTRLRASPTARAATAALRSAVLAGIGCAYGLVVEQLHDRRAIAPVEVRLDRASWTYLGFWAVLAIALGHALPAADRAWPAAGEGDRVDPNPHGLDGEMDTMGSKEGRFRRASIVRRGGEGGAGGLGAEWNPIVRIVGAFVGIAFAIVSASRRTHDESCTDALQRRLPWASTLQVSLTLALVNPMIWYLVDRTRTGFALSAAIAVSGAALLLRVNPAMVPAPPAGGFAGAVSRGGAMGELGGVGYETVGAAVWISSVLFSGTVCLGNIGRRLTGAGSGRGR